MNQNNIQLEGIIEEKNEKASSRNIAVDILKTLAILLIILAHVEPQAIVLQLRTFDVVLLVILSGMLAVKSYEKCKSFFEYFKKRIVRLVLPVWIFLSVFFLGIALFTFITNKSYPYGLKEIFKSYTMINGIGYVWIIRVYILCALTVPIIYELSKKISNHKMWFIILLIYIAYEILYLTVGNSNLILKYIIYYIIPYGFLCTFIGMNLKEWDSKKVLKFAILFIAIFVIIAVTKTLLGGVFQPISKEKYPPTLYYLSYGIGITLLLYYLIGKKNIFNIKVKLNKPFIIFVSTHTMWIYLWHIFYLTCINYTLNNIHWLVKYVAIVIASIITTYVQSKLVNKIKYKFIRSILDC